MPAICTQPVRKLGGRCEFLRGRLFAEDGVWKVKPAAAQGSGVLRSMSEANCFIVVAADRDDVAAGETVPVQLFEGLM